MATSSYSELIRSIFPSIELNEFSAKRQRCSWPENFWLHVVMGVRASVFDILKSWNAFSES
jgi:hypothetical protein